MLDRHNIDMVLAPQVCLYYGLAKNKIRRDHFRKHEVTAYRHEIGQGRRKHQRSNPGGGFSVGIHNPRSSHEAQKLFIFLGIGFNDNFRHTELFQTERHKQNRGAIGFDIDNGNIDRVMKHSFESFPIEQIHCICSRNHLLDVFDPCLVIVHRNYLISNFSNALQH